MKYPYGYFYFFAVYDMIWKVINNYKWKVIEVSNQEQEKQITEEYVDNYLEEKLEIDKNCIVCKYFDLKVIKDLSDKQVDDFLRIAREKLLKKGYEVYFTGAKFVYQNANRTVQDNEFMVAIKEEGDC